MSLTVEQQNIYKNFNFPTITTTPSKLDDKQKKLNKKAGYIGSSIGALGAFTLCVLSNQKNNSFKDCFIKNNTAKTFKNLWDYTKLDYEGLKGYFYMTSQMAGAALGSLGAGFMIDKDKENRKEKIKEAIFAIDNVVIPTAFAKTCEFLIEKGADKNNLINGLNNNKLLKSLTVITALACGLYTSLKTSNAINNNIVDKENKNDKKIKPKDLLVHVDDIIPVLAALKGSIFARLQLDRLMPFIYLFTGAEVGEKDKYSKD